MSLKKAVTIAKSMINDLPVDQKWYQDRISACAACPLNTENMTPEQISNLSAKMKFTLEYGCKKDEKRLCSICGCCTDRKAAVKSETCPKKDIGQEPEWLPIQIENSLDKNIVIENLTPDHGRIFQNGAVFFINLKKTDKPVLNFDIIVQNLKGLKFHYQRVGCSCLLSSVTTIDDKSLRVETKISIKDFRPGLNERSMEIDYFNRNNQKRSVSFKFVYSK